jgi:hypothetical protein
MSFDIHVTVKDNIFLINGKSVTLVEAEKAILDKANFIGALMDDFFDEVDGENPFVTDLCDKATEMELRIRDILRTNLPLYSILEHQKGGDLLVGNGMLLKVGYYLGYQKGLSDKTDQEKKSISPGS